MTESPLPEWIHYNGQAFRREAITRVWKLNGMLFADINTLKSSNPYGEKNFYQNHAIYIKDQDEQMAFCKKIGVNYEKILDQTPKKKSQEWEAPASQGFSGNSVDPF